jgi:hypothetical protein
VPYARSLTRVLDRHLGWHRARLKFMSRFTLGLLRLTTCNLRRLSLALKDDVKPASSYRRIQRFLASYDADFVALGKLMVHLLPQKPPYVVVVDRTEWHFGSAPVNVLVIGIAQQGQAAGGSARKGVAVPVAWMALPKEGGSSGAEQIQVLERFLKIVAPEDIEAVLADREFISARWLETLAERDIPFVVRLRRDRRAGWSRESPTLPVRLWLRGLDPGQTRVLGSSGAQAEGTARSWWLHGKEARPVRAQLVAQRLKDDSDGKARYLLVAARGVDPERATALYGRRWEVETMFGALKSRGFRRCAIANLETTHVTGPARIERLLGLLALALAWAHLVGWDESRRMRAPGLATHGRPRRSVFRQGLDALQSRLIFNCAGDERLRRWLRLLDDPLSVLSCT